MDSSTLTQGVKNYQPDGGSKFGRPRRRWADSRCLRRNGPIKAYFEVDNHNYDDYDDGKVNV
jgi:hypothetical protein